MPPTRRWAEIGVLTRDNAHAEDVFDALTGAGIPVEIVGLSGLLRLPEVAEIVATLHLLHDVTANAALLTLLTGPRWAIGPRDLRLLSRRAHEIAGRQGRGGESASITDHLLEIADGIDPAEIPSLDDALADPGDAPYSAEALERFALLAGELRMLRDVRRRAAARHRPPDHRHQRHRRRARVRGQPGGDRAARQPRPVREGGRGVPGGRRRRHAARAAGLPDRRGRPGQRARRRHPDRGRLGQAADRPPVQGPRVGLGLPRRRRARPASRPTGRAPCGPRRRRSSRRRCAATPTTCRSSQGWDKAALDAYRADTRAHDAEEELRLGYVAFTRAAHHLSVTSYLWSPRATPFGPSSYQEVVRDQLRRVGRAGRRLARQAAEGRPQPVRRGRPVPALAVDRHRPRGRAADRGRRAGSRAVDADARRRRARHDRGRPGRRVGRRARPAARRGAPRPQLRHRRTAAEQPVRHRARPAARGPRDLRPRAGPADAATAVVGGPVRHPLPRLGRGAVRPAGPLRLRRPARPGRRRHRRRRRPQGADRDLRGRSVRDPHPAPGRGAVRAGAGRPGGARPDRRGLHRRRPTGRRLPARRLEDQPVRDRRPAPARRSTGSPGPSCTAYRSSRCGRRSTTSAPASSSSPPTCPTVRRSRPSSTAPDRATAPATAATPRAATRPARLAPMVLADGP